MANEAARASRNRNGADSSSSEAQSQAASWGSLGAPAGRLRDLARVDRGRIQARPQLRRCVSCSRDWSARIFEGGIAIKTMPGWPAMPPGPRDCAAKRGAATRPSYAAQRVRDCDARTLSHSNLVTDFRHQSRISPPASRVAGRRFATTHASVTDTPHLQKPASRRLSF